MRSRTRLQSLPAVTAQSRSKPDSRAGLAPLFLFHVGDGGRFLFTVDQQAVVIAVISELVATSAAAQTVDEFRNAAVEHQAVVIGVVLDVLGSAGARPIRGDLIDDHRAIRKSVVER